MRRLIIASCFIIGMTAGAEAVGPAPQADVAQAFGALEAVRQVAISSDGLRLSYTAPTAEGGSALVVANLDGGGTRPVLADKPDGGMRLGTCDWASADRLICTMTMAAKVDRGVMTFERLVSIGADGSGVRALGHTQTGAVTGGLSTNDGIVIDHLVDTPGQVLLAEHVFAEDSRNTRLAQQTNGLRVVRVNLKSGQRVVVEPPLEDGHSFMTDDHGVVRLRSVRPYLPGSPSDTVTWLQAGPRIDYSFRPRGGGEWRALATAHIAGGRWSFEPLAIDADCDCLYALRSTEGRQALWKLALDGSGREERVLARADVDVEDVVRLGKYGRVAGVRYTTDRGHVQWFDPAMAALSEKLGTALKGKPLVSVLGQSWDENRMIIYAGSDRDPGRYYLLDRGTHKLTEIAAVRPQLDGMLLGEVRSVAVRAGDGTAIPAYLTLPPGRSATNLPAIVMPHGGPAARDEWGFDWWPQYYAQLGYAVIQPNYRGSAGYGDDWVKKNGFRDWKAVMNDVNDSARWLASQGIADPKRIAIVGWSFGGYVALQANITQPGLYQAAVAVAPVTDLALMRDRLNIVSANYSAERAYVGTSDLSSASPARRAGEIAVPTLLFQGERDLTVDPSQARAMETALRQAGKPVELVTYPGLGHSLESSEARADMLRRSAAFLAAHMGPVSPALASSSAPK